MSLRAVKSAVLSNFNQVITFEILTQVKLFRIMVRLVAPPLCAGRANHFFVKFKELQLSESRQSCVVLHLKKMDFAMQASTQGTHGTMIHHVI
jgi:hypothetical protein